MKNIFRRILNLIFKNVSTVSVNGIQYSGKSVQLTNKGDTLVVTVDGVEYRGDLMKEIKISIDSNSDIDKIEAHADLSVRCNNIHGDVSTMSGDVICLEEIHGDVSTMSGDVNSKIIRGDVSTMSGDIKTNKEQ